MDRPSKPMTGKVLVASADGVMSDRVSRVLRETGHAVATTTRSGRMLYRALEDAFDLVIMDLDIEGLSGFESLQILRRALPDLPVVVMTDGHLRERVQRLLVAEGVAACVRKPIEAGDLDEALRISGAFRRKPAPSRGGGSHHPGPIPVAQNPGGEQETI